MAHARNLVHHHLWDVFLNMHLSIFVARCVCAYSNTFDTSSQDGNLVSCNFVFYHIHSYSQVAGSRVEAFKLEVLSVPLSVNIGS